jgi:hypothetical protein
MRYHAHALCEAGSGGVLHILSLSSVVCYAVAELKRLLAAAVLCHVTAGVGEGS